MKKPLTILVAIVVGVVILWKMFFFQVGTGEIAVLTTFRSSTPRSTWPMARLTRSIPAA